MKPYAMIPIMECGEPLVPIPSDVFSLVSPHPYMKLQAPYGDRSPFFVRTSVLELLTKAQTYLQQKQPGWQICIFDAYRPIAVQKFMVEYTFAELLQRRNLKIDNLSQRQRQTLWQEVYQFWARPSDDPATPPPHSTGAAIDVTLTDEQGNPIDMGSPIDELSSRSFPDYFAPTSLHIQDWTVSQENAEVFHQRRLLLHRVMAKVGFRRHPQEWWHFSWGDQLWAWIMNRERMETMLVARYGAIMGARN
ncbi:MAG: M15 family metallopeptidase [Cyanobacteria bacterium P01_F01_bin.150]